MRSIFIRESGLIKQLQFRTIRYLKDEISFMSSSKQSYCHLKVVLPIIPVPAIDIQIEVTCVDHEKLSGNKVVKQVMYFASGAAARECQRIQTLNIRSYISSRLNHTNFTNE